MNNGKGSPIIVLPILVLLLCAGAAALAGIALQPSTSAAVTAAPITEADFGTCATPPGPRPTKAAQVPAWLESVRTCLDSELSGLPGYLGSGVEGFSRDVLVVHWSGEAPAIVVTRVKLVSGDANATVVGTR